MRPDNQALQVFYRTIPLILIIAGFYFRERMLLKDILKRLGSIEDKVGKVMERLIALETRAGIVFHD